MTSSARASRRHATSVVTLGDLVAAFYEEAARVGKNDAEIDRLAKASLKHCLRTHHARIARR